jgi:parvulin-like peptidyl-prolyl isomerase
MSKDYRSMNRAKASFLAGMLAFTVMVSGCNAVQQSKVATVDGTPITKSEYDKTYSQFEKAFHMENVPDAQKSMMADTLKQMTINKLIFQTLVDNEAAKAGVKVTDADIKTYKEEKIFKDPTMKTQFQAFLSQNNMKESDFDEMLKENLLVNKLMDVKGGKDVAVSDTEVKTFYDKNVDQFKMPERIHASHILVEAIVPKMKQELRSKNPKITDTELDKDISNKKNELKTKADEIFSEVKTKPAEFESLAKKDSEDPMSAKNGGDLGFLVEGTTDPAFWAAIAKTPNGQMYPGVVSSQYGYHIVKVLDRQPPHQQTFDEAKEMIRERMSQMKKQIFMQKWAEQEKAIAKIDIEPTYKAKEANLVPPGAAASETPGKATPPAAAMSKEAVPAEAAKH